ncbi:response regulator transcription factor [Emcibacter sp.]|uniref:response regulator transcription factor n=1 Tax=Emcibacter sp. TaxID=1979954 RepID=UPI003A8F0905
MSLTGLNVVAIDDTSSIRTFLRISLKTLGADFHEASTAEEGLELCKSVSPDLVVLDLGLPDRDGLDILPEIKATGEKSPTVVVLTVRKEHEARAEAYRKGADAYLTKPFMMDDLLEVIEEKFNRPIK